MLYNMGSGILRAVGDSRRPLYVLIVCALTNIVLDLLFVIVFKTGVAGAALATVISQWISAIIVLVLLTREKESYKLIWRDLHLDLKTTRQIFVVGFPAGLQMAITSFSNVFVQSYINHFGSSCMAGWTAYGKLDKFCLLPIQSVGLSVTTFVGQNLGANQPGRAKKGTTIALWIALAAAAILMLPVMFFAPALISLFNKEADAPRLWRRLRSFDDAVLLLHLLQSGLRQLPPRRRGLYRADGDYDVQLYCFPPDIPFYYGKDIRHHHRRCAWLSSGMDCLQCDPLFLLSLRQLAKAYIEIKHRGGGG